MYTGEVYGNYMKTSVKNKFCPYINKYREREVEKYLCWGLLEFSERKVARSYKQEFWMDKKFQLDKEKHHGPMMLVIVLMRGIKLWKEWKQEDTSKNKYLEAKKKL